MTKIFEYTVDADDTFPNRKADAPRLTLEIRESAIRTALKDVSLEQGQCIIEFKADLSAGDAQLLDALVRAHSGNPLPQRLAKAYWDSAPTNVKLAGPRQQDGSPYFSPCMFPSGVYLYITGADDSGHFFSAASDVEGDVVDTFSFNDWVLVAGGGLIFNNAEAGDHVSMDVFCPATPVTPNGTNTGNCNVVQGVIVPAAGTGAFDVNLAAANPVLTPLKDGYWTWVPPTLGVGPGTVVVGDPGKSGAHLIAVDVNLIRFVNKAPMLGTGVLDFTIPAIEPKICLSQWKMRMTLHNKGHAGLKLVWHITTARVKTI